VEEVVCAFQGTNNDHSQQTICCSLVLSGMSWRIPVPKFIYALQMTIDDNSSQTIVGLTGGNIYFGLAKCQ
jgi:hypothetical protein